MLLKHRIYIYLIWFIQSWIPKSISLCVFKSQTKPFLFCRDFSTS